MQTAFEHPFAKLREVEKALREHPDTTQLIYDLPRHGGYRGLFDCLASEWDSCPMETKVNILNEFGKVVRLKDLVDAYMEGYNEYGRPDIAMVAEESLARLLPYGLIYEKN